MSFLSTNVDRIQEEKKKAEEAAAAKSSSYSGSPVVWAKITVGHSHRIRLLPPWTDTGPNAFLPYKKVVQHWNVGPDKKKVNCPRIMADDRCHVCDMLELLRASGLEEDKDLASELYAKTQFVYQVIDRDDQFWTGSEDQIKDRDNVQDFIGAPKIKILSLSKTVHEHIVSLIANTDYGDEITNPMSGLDLTFTRMPTGKKTKYGATTKWDVLPVRYPSPLFVTPTKQTDLEAIEACAKTLINLDEQFFFKAHTYEESKMIAEGINPWAKDRDKSDKALPESKASRATALLQEPRTFDTWDKLCLSKGKPLDREHVAKKHGVKEAQIPSCYAKEPDHTDDACWNCPVAADCGNSYAVVHGSSTSKPVNKKRNVWAADPLAAMETELATAAVPAYLNNDDDDDIPF